MKKPQFVAIKYNNSTLQVFKQLEDNSGYVEYSTYDKQKLVENIENGNVFDYIVLKNVGRSSKRYEYHEFESIDDVQKYVMIEMI